MIPLSFRYSIVRYIQDALKNKKKTSYKSALTSYTRETALYRNSFISGENKFLVQKAQSGDYNYFIKHLANQDYKYQNLWDDEYFENRYGMQKIYNLIQQQGNNKLRILDIGCGNCKLLEKLKGLGHDVYGIDLSALRVLKNRQKLKNIVFAYAEDIPFEDDFFDIVIAQEVLEHVFNLESSLSEIKRILKPDGISYIQVPYLNYVESVNHLRVFSEETLNYWINKYLKVENIELIPYKIGNKANNIFVTAKKSKQVDVEFYLMDAFEIYQFLPIYKALEENNFCVKFICEPCNINLAKDWFDYETAKSILNDENLKYSEKANPYAEIAVTTQRIYYLSKYLNFKVNLQYGAGLNKNNFCSTKKATEGFDARLIYGDYTREKIKDYIKGKSIYEIGIPKHDDFFNSTPKKTDIKNELCINTEKKILVYFPTWDEDSSIQIFYEQLKNLREEYFVVSKAHHCTYRLKEKKTDLDILNEISDIVLEGNYSFSKAAVLADIALIDAKSGASCEVPYLNPDVHILYLTVKEHPENYFWNNIFQVGKLICPQNDLIKELHQIESIDSYVEYRKNKISYYLGPRDGKSTSRALAAFQDISKNSLKR